MERPLLSECPGTDDGQPEAPLPPGRCAMLYLLTAMSAIGGFLFGYDTGVVSGAMVLVRAEFHLSDTWHELIVSATVGTAWLLSMAAGPLADRLGRRPVILAASAAFGAGALLAALAGSQQTLLAGRLVLGVGIGLASSTVPVLIAEAAPAEARGFLTTVNIAFTTGGQLAAALLCGALADVTGGWRWMMGVAALPAAVQLPGLLALPESPRFLVARGRRSEAAAALTRLRPTGFPVRTELARVAAQCAREQRGRRACGPTAMLRRPAVRRALLLGCGLQVIQQLAGINTVMYYSASIIQMSGVRDPTTAIWLAALPAAVNFAGTLVGMALVERVGRRPLTLTSLLGTAGALALLAAGFWVNAAQSLPVTVPAEFPRCRQYNCASCQSAGCGFCFAETLSGPANGSCLPLIVGNASAPSAECRAAHQVWAADWCPAPHSWLPVPVLGLCLYLVAFAPGMGPMPWTINAEIYPAWARGSGSGLAASCNWLANLAVSLTFLSLVAALGRPGTFLLYAAVAAAGWLMLLRWLPETRGVPLENMAVLFGGDGDDPPLDEDDCEPPPEEDAALLGADSSPEGSPRLSAGGRLTPDLQSR
ncbi:Proton myo-inositol cotransporter [Amphibalanus amphitrite]|uniref:Proton myo-inositol cotransporter n=1 Tax=Amphibalanus amphitrite TaxID=1232801 RepID=A0A6A4WB98_AMPAM|nr:Proton myo-inositol cotransporter [Amphibalanus amphitrite]